MKLFAFIGIWAALLAYSVPGAFSQETLPTASPKEKRSEEKPVMLGDRPLFHLVTAIGDFSLVKRSREASKRIKKIADSPRFAVNSITTRDFDAPMTFIVAGDEIILSVVNQDTASKGKSRQQLADEYAQVIRTAIQEYRKERSLEQLVSGTIYTLIETIILIGVLILMHRIKRKVEERIEGRFGGWKKGIQIQSYELLRAEKIGHLLKGCLRAIRIIIVLILLYIYVHLLLGFFPITRPFAEKLFGYILSPLATIANGFIDQIPNLIFLTILVLLARYVLKLLKIFFEGVERERIRLSNFYPEWAKSTYRIVRFLLIGFFVVIAFPYIPGSDSMAFKGVSVFVGVLLSLGSQSVISNFIAGFALTYRRLFQAGDRVQIAGFTGDVVEMRQQVTTLRTIKNEEIIVPNSKILNDHVINYSAEARAKGLILHSTVTIGYDTPWRQVHALLLMAARRTSGLLMKPEPFVLQKSLDDFYITYELNVYTDRPDKMAAFYSELHQNILDAFNEYGVQIMSPHYKRDRTEPAIVPKERWYAPPAESKGEIKAPDSK